MYNDDDDDDDIEILFLNRYYIPIFRSNERVRSLLTNCDPLCIALYLKTTIKANSHESLESGATFIICSTAVYILVVFLCETAQGLA